MLTVDIDVGGTLTDGLFGDGESLTAVKVDTTPHDLTVCFRECLQEGARLLGFNSLEELIPQVGLIRWSTTVTSNVLAQRSGPRVGLLVSPGQENSLYGKRAPSPALGSLVGESAVVGLKRPADPTLVMQAVKGLLEQGVRRIVVSLAGAFHDPGDERAIKGIIEEQYPDHFLGAVPVLLGSDVSRFPDDMTRTHQAVINAYVHGPLARSLYTAEDDLRELGYVRPLLIGHANGGVARVSKTKALDTLESGPTLGLFAAAHFARRYGLARVVSLDAGGTTVKIGLVQDGQPILTRELDLFGIPAHSPGILLRSMALGGGSVVRVDPADGRLSLGPESMGAYPGPACYDLGGTEATLTDAFLVLGWLDADNFLGGARRLSVERAEAAFREKVAGPLKMEVADAAQQAVEKAFETTAGVIQEMLKEARWPGEECALFAFGGNGPALACGLVERTGIGHVRVFGLGPVLSAFGSAISDIVHVYERASGLALPADDQAQQDLTSTLERMREEALRDMKGEGLDLDQVTLQLELELEGKGGERRSVSLDLARSGPPDLGALRSAGQPGRLDLIRLRASVEMPRLEPPRLSADGADPSAARRGEREVRWDGRAQASPVYDWNRLRAGQRIGGGAIIETATSTYLVPPDWQLTMDELGNGHLTRG